MQIFSIGENLHEKTKLVFWEKYEKYFKMVSAEIFTKSAKHQFVSEDVITNMLNDYFMIVILNQQKWSTF